MRHLFTATATVITASAWLALSLRSGVAVEFAMAAIIAPLVALVGVLTERPRWAAVLALAGSLSLPIAIYVVLVSLPPDFDP